MKLIKIVLFTIISISMAACKDEVQEGTGSGEGGNTIVILDIFDPADRAGGFLGTPSKVSGSQSVSMVELTNDAAISKIEWSGFTTKDINIGSPTFIIRIYAGDSVPNPSYLNEVVVSAKATKISSVTGSDIYQFEYEADNIFVLPSGMYWLSIVDPETEGLGFKWFIEKDSLSTTSGSGGAFRSSDGDPWQSPNSGIPINEARGRSLKIEGVL